MPLPQLTLLLKEVHPSGDPAAMVERLARVATATLFDRALWSSPIGIGTKGKSGGKKSLQAIDAVAEEIEARAAAGVVAGGSDDWSAEIEFYARESGITIFCRLRVGDAPSRDVLGELIKLGEELFRGCKDDGHIGPGFSIRPLYIDYPRPLPPRNGNAWRPGDAAYLIDRGFHEANAGEAAQGVALLAEAVLPDGVHRHEHDGLIVIACDGPAEDSVLFARQLGNLERWVGEVLSLPAGPGFTPEGDQQVDVIAKEDHPPFTFYDPTTSTAYKALTGNGNEPLDDAELHDAAILADEQGSHDVKPKRVVFVFPDRSAALRNRDALISCGAAATVYTSEDGILWDPAPPGNWQKPDGAGA